MPTNSNTLPNPLPRTLIASVFLVSTTFLATLLGGPAFSWVPLAACGLYLLAVAPTFPLWRVAVGCGGTWLRIFRSIHSAR